MNKILISDAMDKIAQEILISEGLNVDVITNFSDEQLYENIINYNGLIVRSATKVTKKIINNAKNLKIIGRAGAGVDNIDLDAAKSNNIVVMNTPGGNTNATAEHTIALLFSSLRFINEANTSTHKGLWEKKKFKGKEIKGKKIGIIGFGNVGKRVAEICFALGMHVNIFSSYFKSVKNNFKNYNLFENLDEIIKNSDILSFHCKPNKDNTPIIDLSKIKLMSKNGIIINTARGNLVDENDLKVSLENNIISGAAIDVFSTEPAKDSILFNVPNLILTPHIAASTNEAQIIVAEMVAKQISKYFNTGKIINSV